MKVASERTQQSTVSARASWVWWLLVSGGLVVLTVAVYAQAVHYDFVQLDDPAYVSENVKVAAGLTWDSIAWAFTTLHGGYWIPLTWLSYMAEVQFAGMNAGVMHATNLVLHIANTLLLLWLLVRLTGRHWPSVLVAAIFAVHPLHVESVAWVTERKDVLSTLFGFAAIALYAKWVDSRGPSVDVGADPRPALSERSESKSVGPNERKADSRKRRTPKAAVREPKAQSPRPTRSPWLYAAFVLAFLASLMAKPMLVTLPLVLLLLDVWPLGRILKSEVRSPKSEVEGRIAAALHPRLLSLVWEKLPLLAIAGVVGVVTSIAQHPASLQAVPLVARLENAAVASVSYLGKMFWPAHLSPLYLLPPTLMQSQWRWLGGVSAVPAWQVAGAIATLVVVTVLSVIAGRKRPYLFVGWFWYLCTLLPVSGLMQSGPQLMADRFTYVPLVGIALMVSWALAEVVTRVPRSRIAVVSASALVVLACAATARAQLPVWENSVTFWTRATQDALHVGAFDAHVMLGEILHKQGRLDEAKAHFTEACRLQPGSARAHHGLGRLLADQALPAEAIGEFEKAVAFDPKSADAQNDLGAAFAQTGRSAEAREHFAEAVRLDPGLAAARRNLGSLLVALEQWAEAIPQLQEAVRLQPGLEAAHLDLGIALAESHRFDDAIREFDATLRLNPANEIARRARTELSAKMLPAGR